MADLARVSTAKSVQAILAFSVVQTAIMHVSKIFDSTIMALIARCYTALFLNCCFQVHLRRMSSQHENVLFCFSKYISPVSVYNVDVCHPGFHIIKKPRGLCQSLFSSMGCPTTAISNASSPAYSRTLARQPFALIMKKLGKPSQAFLNQDHHHHCFSSSSAW